MYGLFLSALKKARGLSPRICPYNYQSQIYNFILSPQRLSKTTSHVPKDQSLQFETHGSK